MTITKLILWYLATLSLLFPQDVIIVRRAPVAAGGGCTPATFSDSFDRANSDSLGSDWTEAAGDSDIASNMWVNGSLSYATVISVHNTSCGCPTQYVAVEVQAAFSQYPFVILRYTNSSSPFYLIQLDGNNAEVTLKRYANVSDSSPTQIGSAIDLGSVWGTETLAVTVAGTGSSTVIRVWRGVTGTPSAADNWNGDTTPNGTWTDDPANPVDTGNYVGIGTQSGATLSLDDFVGGGLSS